MSRAYLPFPKTPPRRAPAAAETAPPPAPSRQKPASGEYPIATAALALPVTWSTAPSPGAARAETLTFSRGGVDAVVHVVGDAIGWVDSTAPVTPFFARLVSDGLITASELDLVTTLCRLDGGPVADALLRLQLVSSDGLRRAIRDHIRDHLEPLLAAPDVTVARTGPSPLAFHESALLPTRFALGPWLGQRFADLLRERAATEPMPPSGHDALRVPLRRTVTVDGAHGTAIMTTLDLSLVGARLHTTTALATGQAVVVRINVAGQSLTLPGRIVSTTASGAGHEHLVQWENLSPHAEAALANLMSLLY